MLSFILVLKSALVWFFRDYKRPDPKPPRPRCRVVSIRTVSLDQRMARAGEDFTRWLQRFFSGLVTFVLGALAFVGSLAVLALIAAVLYVLAYIA